MANYWVPRKNRCNCIDCSGSETCIEPVFYTKSKTSSLFSQLKASGNTYSAGNLEPVGNKPSIKSNLRKHGSGGNSYSAYMSRKVGAIQYKQDDTSCLKCN